MGASNTGFTTALPYLIGVNILVGLLVTYSIWAFRSGRWVEEQSAAHDELGSRVSGVQDELRRTVGDIKTAITEEHKQRREFIDRINETFGSLAQTQARHDERLKALENKK